MRVSRGRYVSAGYAEKRTRPAADLFVKLDKNYQAIIRQLNELTPPEKNGGRLAQLLQGSPADE